MKWVKKTLYDLADIIMGQSPPSRFYNEEGNGIPFFQGKTEFGALYPLIKKYTTKITREAKTGDILFTVRAPVGDINIANISCCIGRGLSAIRSKEDSKFLFYLIKNSKNKFLSKSGRAIYDSINKDDLSKVSFHIPEDRKYRDKIASVLSAYDDLTENNLRRINLLEEAARLIYKEWFVRLRFPGYEHTQIADGVPEGWKYKNLGDICKITMGQSPKSEFYNENEERLPFHQGVSDFGNRFITHSKYCTKHSRTAEKYDILCSVRAPVGRLNITLDKIIIGRGLSAIQNNKGFQTFQFYQLKTHFYQEDMIGGGAIFASMTRKQFESRKMLVPTDNLISEFERIVRPMDRQMEKLFCQNQKLRQTRDILLPRLMNGSIQP
ncbi:restriction endonuclease subunit S [Desulfobacterales bacterium HSG2]|nr:restriction endonuclease subunit S [Desulfobacterales bacterium HSG2]